MTVVLTKNKNENCVLMNYDSEGSVIH